jgi:hypothetical protein
MAWIFVILLTLTSTAYAQTQSEGRSLTELQQSVDNLLSNKWYEKLAIRGYFQFRYNRLGETNGDLTCTSCDKSLGENQGFFIRRGRLVLFGEISNRVFIYIQPDYATESSGTQNYFQIRDAYFDYALTDSKEWRIRTGISKVPYGFQNMQSSSNRGPLDRDEALNSAVPNERDTGLYLMYAPTQVRKRFQKLTKNNLKGSGDYGMLAIGAHNGQTLNKPEKNNDLHRVIRLTYPFELQNGQFIETSLQAYEGKFNVSPDNEDFYEQRTAASLIIYPQPLGFQAEYNVGQGPEYDPKQDRVRTQSLKGGYAMVNYQFILNEERFFPFIRFQNYQGGRKVEDNARAYRVNEWEIGTEWQPHAALELTVAYTVSDRRTQSSPLDRTHEKGNLIRLQAQFNY